MPALKSIIINLMIKFSGTLLSLVLTILIIKFWGVAPAGQFFFFISVTMVTAAVLRNGYDGVILKNISRLSKAYSEYDYSQIINFATSITRKNTIFFFPVYLIGILLLSFFKNEAEYLAMGSLFYIASYLWAILNLQNNYLLGKQHPQIAGFLISILPPAFTLGMVWLCILLSLNNIYVLCLIYILSVLIPTLFFEPRAALCRDADRQPNKILVEAELICQAKHLHLPSILSLVNIWVPTIILGLVSSDNTVAIFNSANRVSIIFIFVSTSINSIISPKISFSYKKHKDKAKALYWTLKGSLFGVLIAAVPMAIFGIYSDEIMTIFSPDFVQQGNVLKILLLGQISTIILGGAAHLLIMTDNESLYRKAMLISSLFSFFIILMLSTQYGLVGCAVGTAIGFWASNIILFFLYLKAEI